MLQCIILCIVESAIGNERFIRIGFNSFQMATVCVMFLMINEPLSYYQQLMHSIKRLYTTAISDIQYVTRSVKRGL